MQRLDGWVHGLAYQKDQTGDGQEGTYKMGKSVYGVSKFSEHRQNFIERTFLIQAN
jgi:hypothetical protein